MLPAHKLDAPPVLALDLAWGGTGVCLATVTGPVWVRHEVLQASWRWKAVDAFLTSLEEAGLPSGHALVIERPPSVYQGAGRAGGAGNQVEVGYGMGRLAGAVELWGYHRFSVGLSGYPFLVDVADWRGWWNLPRGKRRLVKQAAINRVTMQGWRSFLEPFLAVNTDCESPVGDVAEAILQAVGIARHPEVLPKGPKR